MDGKLKNAFLALSLLLLCATPDKSQIQAVLSNGGGNACVAPTMTYRWVVANTSNTCGGGGNCTNGGHLDKLVDSVAANNATQTTDGDRPTYTTSCIGGQPCASFNGSSDFLTLASSIPTSTAVYAFYIVFTTPASSGGYGILGNPSGTDNSINLRAPSGLVININIWGTSGNPYSTGISTSTTYTLGGTYTASTKAWAFYNCSSGSCSSFGSGTQTGSASASNAMTTMGDTFFGYMGGKVAEIGFSNSSLNTTTLGTYSKCQYGI